LAVAAFARLLLAGRELGSLTSAIIPSLPASALAHTGMPDRLGGIAAPQRVKAASFLTSSLPASSE